MWRKPLLPVAAIAALVFSAAAAEAQEPPAPAAAAPAAAAAPTPHRTYSPAQMQSFARATVELQALGSQDPAAMTGAIQGAGMSVEDYNQMGDAMRADPALATGLNPYLDSAGAERAARIYAAQAQSRSREPAAPARHAASNRHVATQHSHGRHHASGHTRTAHHGHAAKTTRRHAAKGASHAKASGRHTSRAKHRAASTSHASRRHRHS